MAWDAVPWFVGGGAQHSPEVARLLAYAATGSAEGIVTPGDLKVAATAVPSGAVTIAPGDCLIRNRAQGGQSQTYVGRNPVEDTVSISSTGGATRSDLIVAQIEDPYMAGEPWQEPEEPTEGPYIFTRVIPNVPPWTTKLQDVDGYEGRTAIALARVDIPASTGTITDAMITDLRKLAQPRRERQLWLESVMDDAALTETGTWVQFPSDVHNVKVPEWATSAQIVAQLVAVSQGSTTPTNPGAGQILAELRIRFADIDGASTVVDINSGAWVGDGATVHPLVMKWQSTAEFEREAVKALQGQTVPVKLYGKRLAGTSSDTGYLNAIAHTAQIYIDVEFTEEPV